MKQSHRKQSGSVLLFMTVIMIAILMPLMMMFSQIGVYIVYSQRVHNVVEAAGLLAANDVSRIVINDPHFGYVSLSNYPPTGKATSAPDGLPLPVTGINTLIGTLRQNAIVASVLGNRTISALVNADRGWLGKTIEDLNTALAQSLDGSAQKCTDIDGEMVNPAQDVVDFLNANLPNNMEVESVRLTNGWLADGATTTIPVPQPQQFSFLMPEDCQAGNYKPYVDVPAAGYSFCFAGIGPSSSIVNSGSFQEADPYHICSIIRLECVVRPKTAPFLPVLAGAASKIQAVVCCQPFTQPDNSIAGGMTLRMSGGGVPGLQSWLDFLSSTRFSDHQIMSYNVIGGDYPVDQNARMDPIQSQQQSTTAQQFAEHFYYWLRNGHLHPRIDSILSMVNQPFESGTGVIYSYEFTENGGISRKNIAHDPFPVGVTADAQTSTVIDTGIPGGLSPVIIFRDNVKNLGTRYGGKHAGQPLAGYPLNWWDMLQSGSSQQMAPRFGRRDTYRGGLAVDVEIGGTRLSTAALDVASMRKVSRRI